MSSLVPFNANEENLLFAASPLTLVEHLSYYELQLLYGIPPHEFMKTDRDPHTGISAMIDHFNNMSLVVVSSLVSTRTLFDRVRLCETWIEVMDIALQTYNFQLVFEIYAALCHPCVARMDRMWRKISEKAERSRQAVRDLAKPVSRFEVYRNELNKIPIGLVVPYIGPWLTQFVYITQGVREMFTLPATGEVVPNYSKFRAYGKTIEGVSCAWGSDLKFLLNRELLSRIELWKPEMDNDTDILNVAKGLDKESN
jgi:hypothetical protein